ncbi:hypothetical protein AVEN_157681-1 [Araneus ventricosus]|uniref:Uncharacterized protein n=1 Tax=Araneus ventricosus TaxID=182803 RepID=A0A4Y2J4I5_ARAVE|nr:hypothetical protein AVEN_157681-1 [Araneus ventricosus]
MATCFICDNELENGNDGVVEVKEKGVESFRRASIQRKDGKVNILTDKISIKVHKKCQKNYVNAKLIAAVLKRGSITVSMCESPITRSTITPFSFKRNCFLCGLEITKEFLEHQKRLPVHLRNVVYQVQTNSVRETVLQQAEKKGDDWVKAIIHRILPVSELPPVDAQYHNECMKNLYKRNKANEKKKRGKYPTEIEHAMACIYDFFRGFRRMPISIE